MVYSSVFFTTVIPILAVISANSLYASSYLLVRLLRRKKSFGTMNPMPWAMGLVCVATWHVYGAVINDLPLIIGCALGTVLYLFATTSALTLLDGSNKPEDKVYLGQIETILVVSGLVWAVLAFAYVLTDMAPMLMGMFATFTSMLLYMAPASRALEVIRTRDAASIYLPQVLANSINAALWVLYGLAIDNLFLYGPYTFAVFLCCCQITLKILYPSKPVAMTASAIMTPSMKESDEQPLWAGNDTSLRMDGGARSTRARTLSLVDDAIQMVQDTGLDVFEAVRFRSESTLQAVESGILSALEMGNLLPPDIVSLSRLESDHPSPSTSASQRKQRPQQEEEEERKDELREAGRGSLDARGNPIGSRAIDSLLDDSRHPTTTTSSTANSLLSRLSEDSSYAAGDSSSSYGIAMLSIGAREAETADSLSGRGGGRSRSQSGATSSTRGGGAGVVTDVRPSPVSSPSRSPRKLPSIIEQDSSISTYSAAVRKRSISSSSQTSRSLPSLSAAGSADYQPLETNESSHER